PSRDSELTIRIGRGLLDIMTSVAWRPSMWGILMSMLTTSGLSTSACVTASRPSRASPHTSSWGSEAMMLCSTLRMNAESSTTSTRVLFPGVISICRSAPKPLESLQPPIHYFGTCIRPLSAWSASRPQHAYSDSVAPLQNRWGEPSTPNSLFLHLHQGRSAPRRLIAPSTSDSVAPLQNRWILQPPIHYFGTCIRAVQRVVGFTPFENSQNSLPRSCRLLQRHARGRTDQAADRTNK